MSNKVEDFVCNLFALWFILMAGSLMIFATHGMVVCMIDLVRR